MKQLFLILLIITTSCNNNSTNNSNRNSTPNSTNNQNIPSKQLTLPILDLKKEYPEKNIYLQDIADVEYIDRKSVV